MRSTPKHRKPPPRLLKHDDQGRPLCRWCGKVVKPPRRSWCSQECADARLLEFDPRGAVKKRDHGICASCGLDADAIRAEAYLVYNRIHALGWGQWNYGERIGGLLARWVQRRLPGRDVSRLRLDRSWWEADHAVPLIEGGSWGLDNLRTLCTWCHKAESAKLAARRAKSTRDAAGPTC